MTDDPLLLIAFLACVSVLIILLLGINSFRQGGPDGGKQSNKYMRWRIGVQFVAVLLILALFYFRRETGS